MILGVHGALLAYGAYAHSPTFDEPGHLVAGISHWEFGRFDLYRVNPPLVRTVGALPVVLSGYRPAWGAYSAVPGSRSVFAMGSDFVTANGERTIWLLRIARWSCVPFGVAGCLACFVWSRDLYGQRAGYTAALLWCFSPNMLGHGQLITSDTAATAFGLTAGYVFWRWLKRPAWWLALAAGLTLGLAELSKLSMVILFALWPALWLIRQIGEWRLSHNEASDRELGRSVLAIDDSPIPSWRRQAVQLLTIVLVASYIVNVGYGFSGTCTSLRDFTFVSEALAGKEGAVHGGNRFADEWFGVVPIPFPRDYVLGFDIQKRDFEKLSWPSYLRGEWKEGGWWHYYIYGLLVKVPLGSRLLFIVAIALALRRQGRAVDWGDELVLLLPALALLLLASSQTQFNHHLRYVFPSLGAFLVFAGRAGVLFAHRSLAIRYGVLALLVWSILSSLWIYPHSLSFFNELAGGPRNGHKHLLCSNMDWGQDLLYFRTWLDEHPEARPCQLVHFGYFEPRDIGVLSEATQPYVAASVGSRGHCPVSVWCAVSINTLCGDPWGRQQIDLERLRPRIATDLIGYTIYVFRIEDEIEDHSVE